MMKNKFLYEKIVELLSETPNVQFRPLEVAKELIKRSPDEYAEKDRKRSESARRKKTIEKQVLDEVQAREPKCEEFDSNFIITGSGRNKFYHYQIENDRNITLKQHNQTLSIGIARSLADSSEARRARLKKANDKPEQFVVETTAYRRNPDVVAEVLSRANGKCEGCGNNAPFIRKSDNTPYLEVHHTIPLSKGGSDTVENAIALCPNCHRRKHFG